MSFQILVLTLIVGVMIPQGKDGEINIPSRLIIGGKDCNPLAFEYFVTFKPSGQQKQSLCGGSIISAAHVLTCAHCCTDFEAGFILTAPERVKLKWRWKEKITVDSVIIHDDYNPDNHDYDYAILKLTKNITIEGSEIVELANTSFMKKMFKEPNATVVSMGFGSNVLTPEGLTAKDFNKGFQCLDMAVSKGKYCLSAKNMAKKDRMFCAFATEGEQQSAAPGDSGGPVTFQNVQVGLVSTGFPGKMTTFVRVDAVLDWIDKIRGQPPIRLTARNDASKVKLVVSLLGGTFLVVNFLWTIFVIKMS